MAVEASFEVLGTAAVTYHQSSVNKSLPQIQGDPSGGEPGLGRL